MDTRFKSEEVLRRRFFISSRYNLSGPEELNFLQQTSGGESELMELCHGTAKGDAFSVAEG